MQFKRTCPKCNKPQEYAFSAAFYRAVKENKMCKSCCRIGKKCSNETRVKLSKVNVGKKQSIDTRLKNSYTNKKRFLDNPGLKEKSSEISKKVLNLPDVRKKHIDALSKTRWLGKTFDRGQIEYVENLNKMGFNFEINYQIHTNDFLCYLDGYDKEKNIVLEYDTPYHNTIKQIEKDVVRQKKIIQILAPKEFWRFSVTNNRLNKAIL